MDCKLQRVGHIAVAYDDQIVIWGGYRESGSLHNNHQPAKYYNPQEIVIYDPVTNTVTSTLTTGQVPPSNSGACGVAVDEFLYIYGGYLGDPDFEGNTNHLYRLNLKTKIWARLEPTGHKPLHRDKLLGWEHEKKIYFFGGFGTPPVNGDPYSEYYQYVSDNSHSWFMGRGWNNQLVAYNIEHNKWEWPITKGQTPCPRAALAGFKLPHKSKIYIFGGRQQQTRMNDMYALDLQTMQWSEKSLPCGRSWHSFTAISSTTAILYGGLTASGEVLSDCWIYNADDNSWVEVDRKGEDKRVWHQGVHVDGEVIIIGGVKTNIASPVPVQQHAENLLIIPSAPKSLLRLSLEVCSENYQMLGLSSIASLPQHLQKLIKMRQKALT